MSQPTAAMKPEGRGAGDAQHALQDGQEGH